MLAKNLLKVNIRRIIMTKDEEYEKQKKQIKNCKPGEYEKRIKEICKKIKY